MNPKDQATLNNVLSIITEAAQVAQLYPSGDVQAGAAIASGLLSLVQKGVAAYEQHTGQPIDLSALHKIDPIA